MDTFSAFFRGQATKEKRLMVFDWVKAAQIIKDAGAKNYAEAGLAGDWEYTGGTIYNNRIVEDSYTYLASTWATPQILINEEYYDCYIMEDETDWGPDTKWPEEAKKILEHL